jgi:hypothetical protein
MTPYQMHLLLPADNETDEQTVMEYIYDILVEAFDVTDDQVDVEYDIASNNENNQQIHTVSVIYESTWRCQIHFNDKSTVLRASQQWSRQHATEYSAVEKIHIAQCSRRLDIISDPDPQHDYNDDFMALSDYVRNMLGSSYCFDPIRNIFLR